MNPEIYSKIVAKRPELAVKDGIWTLQPPSGQSIFWQWYHPQYVRHGDALSDMLAHALIESHWLRKLEKGYALVEFYDRYFVYNTATTAAFYNIERWAKETPLAALTEHFSKE